MGENRADENTKPLRFEISKPILVRQKNKFLLATTSPTNLFIFVEIATADKPEQLVHSIRRSAGMTSNTDYGFENMIIARTGIAQMKRNKYVAQVNIRLGEVMKPKVFQKITCECKTEAINFIIQHHRQRRSQLVVRVKVSNPIIEICDRNKL